MSPVNPKRELSASSSAVLRAVVTGTGRCGTRHAAAVLRAGHERVFTPFGPRTQHNVTVDVSWMAMPYLQGLKVRGVRIVHLVRHPLATITSMLSVGFLMWTPTMSEYVAFAWNHCPILGTCGTPLEIATLFYLEWNERIERYAHMRVRVEDGPVPLCNALDAVSGEKLEPIDSNTQRASVPYVTINRLPLQFRDRVHEMAKRYGYKEG